MSAMRKLERNVVRSKCYKQNGNTSKFADEWKSYRETKFGKESIPVSTMPKKKRFFDKKDEMINVLRYQKIKFQEYMANLKKDKEVAAE